MHHRSPSQTFGRIFMWFWWLCCVLKVSKPRFFFTMETHRQLRTQVSDSVCVFNQGCSLHTGLTLRSLQVAGRFWFSSLRVSAQVGLQKWTHGGPATRLTHWRCNWCATEMEPGKCSPIASKTFISEIPIQFSICNDKDLSRIHRQDINKPAKKCCLCVLFQKRSWLQLNMYFNLLKKRLDSSLSWTPLHLRNRWNNNT